MVSRDHGCLHVEHPPMSTASRVVNKLMAGQDCYFVVREHGTRPKASDDDGSSVRVVGFLQVHAGVVAGIVRG